MAALTTAAALTLAIVTQDGASLRAAPSAQAATHAALAAGDLVELRGERLDHWQVYDHRRERAGYVRATQLRPVTLTEAEAPQLLAVVRFLRDMPGAEALGIAYVAAYLKAVPAAAISAEPFDALGTMAERLARRASATGASKSAAAQLETVAQYGVKFTSYEREGALQLCYDGEAFARVLGMPTSAEQRARAALALTRHDCIDPRLAPSARAALDLARADRLDALDAAAFARLPELAKNRLHLRRAGVWSAIAFQRSRSGAPTQSAGQRALDELAAVNKAELGDDEQAEYTDAALRVGASRWAAQSATAPAARLAFEAHVGDEPGQTCVSLVDPKQGAAKPLARRCTYATVWSASARVAADGRTAVLAVQPLATWTELWVFRADRNGWTVDVLPPTSAIEPGLGYIEFAGFVPGQNKLLVAREARADGKGTRRFEMLSLASLNAERGAGSPQLLASFTRWQDPAWKRDSVSLR